MEILAVTLLKLFGPALARVVFTLALGDEIKGGDIAESLVDGLDIRSAIGRLTGDDRKSQREGSYLFETIGDEVAESLAVVFAVEGERLAQAEKELVAQAAAQTLEEHALSLLLTNDLQLESFRDALLALTPPRSLHQQEHYLYKRVLEECSQRVFEVAEKLPQFERDSVAELLQRMTQMQEDISKLIIDLGHMYKTSQINNPDQVAATFERDYRTLLAKELDKLRLFGVPQVGDYEQPLTVAFVTLTMAGEEEADEKVTKLEMRAGHRESRRVDVIEALAASRRLLLVGTAGAGKTTLLKWVAVRAATQDFGEHDEALREWKDKVPFFLRLRDFAQKQLPTFEQIAVATRGVEGLADRLPVEWTDGKLRSGQAVVLVDGLDEVNQAKREEAYAWLEDLLALYPHAIYLVSTRPNTVTDATTVNRFGRAGFKRFTLQAMEPESVWQFIDRWHEAMGDDRCLLSAADKAALPELARKLQDKLEWQPNLLELARIPLLCAMICAVHQTRSSILPADRIQLYRDCIEMLLEGRDLQRGVDMSGYGITLNLREKERLLAGLAFMMMHNNLPVISHDRAIRQLAEEYERGKAILMLLLERSGLLQAQTADEFDFVHRTFQEYLAAKQIIHKDYIEAACQRAADLEWRETIRLMAGLAESETTQKTVMEQLLKMAKDTLESEARDPFLILALECYSLMAMPGAIVTELAHNHANMMIKQEPDGEIDMLAHSLSLAESAVTNVTPLAGLSQLQGLDLMGTGVTDVTPLAGLSQLQQLYLSGPGVTDVTPLAGLSQLQVLSLYETGVTDVTPLAGLSQLQGLDLMGTGVTDVTPLVGLSQLQHLDLRGTGVTDVSVLAGLSQLEIIR